jgi:hypothetical protein
VFHLDEGVRKWNNGWQQMIFMGLMRTKMITRERVGAVTTHSTCPHLENKSGATFHFWAKTY